MYDKLFSHMGNPIKAKLILEIHAVKQATADQLSKKFTEIPQATLYRHLRKMLEDGILKIAGENRIRGTVEKVYALGFDFDGRVHDMLTENDGDTFLQFIAQYLQGILREFQEYALREDIDLAGDGLFHSVKPFYATKEELGEALAKMNGIIEALCAIPPGKGRKLRNFCNFVTPPKNIDGRANGGKE